MLLLTYIRLALRNMLRNVRFSVVHILGLSVGLSSAILIAWYIHDELSFDTLPEADQVYRINTYWGDDPTENIYATTPPPLAATIAAEVPEIDKIARAFTWNHSTMRLPAGENQGKDEVVFRETRIFIVDPDILEVLQYPVIAGNRESAFERNEAIVLTRKTAERYFGKESITNGTVIGKSILFGGDRTARVVSAVVDPPGKTHFHFDMLVSINFGYTVLDTMKVWTWNVMHTYVKVHEVLKNNLQKQNELQAKLSTIAKRVLPSSPEAIKEVSAADFRLQPIADIHLHSNLLREHEANGDYSTVQLLATVAILILLLACANFINLFTAQSARRAKEVGVRKTLGSSKGLLAIQFFVESGLYIVISAFLALSLAELLLIPLNSLTGKQIKLAWMDHPALLGGVVTGFILIMLLSGGYPAAYLSSFNPVRALKGNAIKQSRTNLFRNALVIFQFTISIGLMICSVFIFKQLLFMQTRAPGYQRENVVIVQNDREIQDQWQAFRNELISKSQIINASFTTGLPVQPLNVTRDFRRAGDQSGFGMNLFLADENYVSTLGLSLVRGSNFSNTEISESKKVLVNETAARMLGDVGGVGEELIQNYGSNDEDRLEIIGVVKDFNVESLHSSVKPIIFKYYIPDFTLDYIAVRIRPGNPAAGLAEIEKAWRKFEPENPFVYSFLDEDFERQFISEQRLSRLFGALTMLAVGIAMLGLTGLASFMAEQRTKEIGIRKVLGASAVGIIVLFSRDFTRLIVISMVIAIPASFLLVREWLSGFVYRIEMTPTVFILCSVSALLLVWATVSILSLSVARLDPAKTLKSE
ncbi:MAG: ABC transporter permease [Chryseolinea sp.]